MTPMDDRAWECSMCDEDSAELATAEERAEESERLRTLWFNENSTAQAALGRVRELAAQWERSAATENPRNYAASLFGTAARDLRKALADGPASLAPPPPKSCTACDYGYPASACSSSCDCGACR